MNDIQLARLLGLASLGMGALELTSGRRLSRDLGVEQPGAIETFGAREVVTGALALAYPDSPLPVWGRVAGDVLDLALLASALGSHNRRRHNAAWAAIGVLGLTLVDVACAVALTRRVQHARQTGRRTRVHRPIGTPMPKPAQPAASGPMPAGA
ncbi:MAG: hypothetical protein NVSMB18_02110 [Acetobacteraceae bacterium]